MSDYYSKVVGLKPNGDRTFWEKKIDDLNIKDIFYTPEYAEIFEKSFGYEAQLFFHGNDQNFVVYPYLKIKHRIPFFYNITSMPHGYCGPIIQTEDKKLEIDLFGDFLEKFHIFCISNNIISESISLHPFIENHIPLMKSNNTKKSSEIVYIDLKSDMETLWKNLTKSNRECIVKSRRNNVNIFPSRKKEHIESFYKLYINTMERVHAQKSYFYSIEFFKNIFELLKNDVTLFIAEYNDQVIAATLFIHKDNFIHPYLGGSDRDFSSKSPNNLLYYEVALWGKRQGYEIFNFGGGSNDSLFRFKSSFSKTTADYYTYDKIHKVTTFRLLSKLKMFSRYFK